MGPIEFVSEKKFREIESKYSAHKIMEKRTCQTFFWQNKEMVCTSGFHHRAEGIEQWKATEVVELSMYKGELKPLQYGDHWQDVDKGNRQRSYTGMLVKQGNRELVFVDHEITFQAAPFGQQLSLFDLIK